MSRVLVLIFWAKNSAGATFFAFATMLANLGYLHTCILAYLHTCILAYLHTCILADMHTWDTWIPAYLEYLDTCIPADIHIST